MAAIDESVVNIQPSFVGFKANLKAGLTAATKGVHAQVRLSASTTGFAADARAKLALIKNMPTMKVALRADAKGLSASVRAEVAKLGQPIVKVQVVADAKSLKNVATEAAAAAEGGGTQRSRTTRKKAGGVKYTRLRKPIEKVEQARQQAIETNLARIRVVEERYLRDVQAAYKQHFKILKGEQDEAYKSYADNILDLNELHTKALAEDLKRTQDHEKALSDAHSKAIAEDQKRARGRTGLETQIARNAEEQITGLRDQALKERARDEERAAVRSRQILSEQTRAQANAVREQARQRKQLYDQVKTPKIINYGGAGIRPINLLYGALAALSPALIAVGASAVQASTSLVALGSAAYGTTLAVVGITNAFSGVLEAYKLHQAAVKSDTTQSAKAASQDIQNQRAVAAAVRGVDSARRSLRDAVIGEKEANDDLKKSYEEARRAVEDLRESLSDLKRQEEGDKIDLARAKEEKSGVDNNFFASDLDRREANQKVADATDKLSDTQRDAGRVSKDLADREKKSLDQQPEVVKARDAARDATNRRKDAEGALIDSQDALRESQDKLTGAINDGSAADAQLKKRLSELSPAAKMLYDWLIANEDKFKDYRRAMEKAILPGFLTFLKEITKKPKGKGAKSTLDILVDGVKGVGKQIGTTVGEIGKFFASPLGQSTFKTLNKDQEESFKHLGKAAVIFLRPVFRLFKASSPLVVRFSKKVEKLAQKFSDWVDTFSDDDLAMYFKNAGDELGKWWDIASNLGSFLVSVFGQALPTGDNLTSRIEKVTGQLSMWAKSKDGQTQIKKFFDFFKNLDYTKISQIVGQIVVLNSIFKAGRFVAKHPVFVLLALLLKEYPEKTQHFLEIATSSLVTLLDTFASNPAATGKILAVLAAFKVGKTLGFDVRVPAINSLKTALTDRFKTLDKFTNGGASTATMTVKAGVVNIYGGSGLTPGKPSTSTTVVGNPTDSKGNVKEEAGKGAKRGLRGGKGILAGVIATAVASVLIEFVGADDKNGFQAGLIGGLKSALNGAMLGSLLGPIGIAAGATIGVVANEYGKRRAELNTAQGAEKYAYDNVKGDIARFGPMNQPVNDPKVVKRKAITDYVTARKKSVDAKVEETRAKSGDKAAEKVRTEETKKSADALADLLVQYGYTPKKAKDYADAVTGLNDVLYTNNLRAIEAKNSTKKHGQAAETAGNKAKTAAEKAALLAEQLKVIEGTKTVTLTIDGVSKVFGDLTTAVAYQQIIKRGLEPTESKVNQIKNQILTKNNYKEFASGGKVTGFSPTDSADNIPAMLTADEYVQPVKAVKHYGTDFMEAVRTRTFPRFAKGGLVGGSESWPFKMTMPQNALAAVEPEPQMDTGYESGGVASGSIKVGETAESTARAMGATTKQLVALIEAGLVESGLRNISYGDRDSLGFLQQRASWGSRSARLDVATATRKFIATARRMDNPKIDAGELAARVQRPRADLRYKYGARQADAVAVINRKMPFLSGYVGGGNGAVPGGYDTKAGLVAFGRWLQAKGYQVTEHPLFGGVHPVHVTNSQHYRESALDVNHGAGTSREEQAYLRRILPEAHRRGFRSIFMAPGHYNHAHFDLGAGHRDGGLIRMADGGTVPRGLPTYGTAALPARLYDNGGQIAPGLTLINNKTGTNETVLNNTQQRQVSAEPQTMRLDRRDVMQLAQAIAMASNQTVEMDGRKVAEITNRYSYLPAGV